MVASLGLVAALGSILSWWRQPGPALKAVPATGDDTAHDDDVAKDEVAHDDGAARMVSSQLRARGIADPRVLRAMAQVPRHLFVPSGEKPEAYADSPLPIGHGQTISQPYIVALMTEYAQVEPDDKVLDVGTGSGYQAAVLAELVKEVYSIEIVPELAETARRRLEQLSYTNVEVRTGDGYQGWPEHAPFDAIILAAAPDHVPQPLIDQLAPGGRLILPVGTYNQMLVLIEKQPDGTIEQRHITSVAFVPMTGKAEEGDAE